MTAKSGMTDEKFTRRMKDFIRNHHFFQHLFEKYDAPLSEIDNNLTFKIVKMHGKYAKGNENVIYVNEKLFRKGDFFTNKVHFIVHEIIHWLTRQKEKEYYFTDPEEIDAFTYSIMYEILRGIDRNEIFDVFYPIIQAHFKSDRNAKKFFSTLYFKANHKANKYNSK